MRRSYSQPAISTPATSGTGVNKRSGILVKAARIALVSCKSVPFSDSVKKGFFVVVIAVGTNLMWGLAATFHFLNAIYQNPRFKAFHFIPRLICVPIFDLHQFFFYRLFAVSERGEVGLKGNQLAKKINLHLGSSFRVFNLTKGLNAVCQRFKRARSSEDFANHQNPPPSSTSRATLIGGSDGVHPSKETAA